MYRNLIIVLLALAACKGGSKADYEVKAELQMIDTLQARLNEIRTWIDYLPLAEIQERKDIIGHNYEFIDQRYRETGRPADLETSQLMDEYKSYGKMYGRAADSFKPIVMEMEELLIQLKTLKESAYSKDYKKETFLSYFAREKDDALKLYDFARTVLLPVKETDLAYERAQKKVEELAEELRD